MLENTGRIILDIHGMAEEHAKGYIISQLNAVESGVSEVVVVHGYRSGSKLKDMVRRSLKHPKICRKILTLNNGETILLLKKE